MVSPKESQALGIVVSIIAGLVVFAVVRKILAYALDFWYLDKVLAPGVATVLGLLSAYFMFVLRQREVPLVWVGVSLALGKPTGRLYENGNHWVFPFFGLQNVPGENEKFILKMPGEMFNAQDGNLVYFGISKEEPEKRNRIQYSVVDPIKYIAVDAPEDGLREAYLEKARLFFGQATKAYGVKNEQTLFSDYIVLPPKGHPGYQQEYNAFKERLERAEYTPRGGETPTEHLFTPESVELIMQNAGEFRQSAATWGIGNIFAFTPNVRENPEMEQADAARQAATAQMSAAKTKTAQIKKSTKSLVKDGVSPDLAMALAARLAGEDIEIDNKTFTVSGIPEVIKALGERAITAFAKPSPPPKQP